MIAQFDSHQAFEALTGNPPLAWQRRLLDRWRGPAEEHPTALDLPTGLGKTSVMPLWLIARCLKLDVPRRLVYVVDRRAVVDQATEEAEKLAAGVASGVLTRHGITTLPVSTLRGQHADNRDWLADPAALAIIVGTVDMIGSRLLFEGYAASRGMRPYMAGLLGVDTLVVLDEAHLVPPFAHMLKAVVDREGALRLWPAGSDLGGQAPALRLLTLSATGRDEPSDAPGSNEAKIFGLTENDWNDAWVKERLDATKNLTVQEPIDGKSLPEALASTAWSLREEASTSSGQFPRILIFCDKRDDALKVQVALRKRGTKGAEIDTELLVGARRVFERDSVADWLEKRGFTGRACWPAPTFLIATSAGEVGVDMDADHMVCDLVEWERMVQRLGRVNRRGGKTRAAKIIVLPELLTDAGTRPDIDARRAPFDHLETTGDGALDASPGALRRLKQRALRDPRVRQEIDQATTREPLRPALTRPLVEAWSMTSLDDHPGRPEVAPWLRGWTDDDPQTTLIWRTHLPVRRQGTFNRVDEADVDRFFAAARPHLLERLEAGVPHAADILSKRAKACLKAAEAENATSDSDDRRLRRDEIVLLMLGPALRHRDSFTLQRLAEHGKDELVRRAADTTLVLDARLGGLTDSGLLDVDAKATASGADTEPPFGSDERKTRLGEQLGWRVECRQTIDGDETPEARDAADTAGIREQIFPVAFNDYGEPTEHLHVLVRRGDRALEGDPAVSRREQALARHLLRSVREVLKLARDLGLSDRLSRVLAIATGGHDSGKHRAWAGPGRDWWQDAMRAPINGEVKRPLAKTKGPVNVHLLRGYRHEFGSLGDIETCRRFKDLDPEDQDLVLHLIAAHHGYARPFIRPIDPALPDGSPALERRAREAALRFVRLQERYGPWRLAWLETLLRAADWTASAANDARETSRGKDREKMG